MIRILLLLGLLVSFDALGCSFDTDCAVGSRCVKDLSRIEGYCAGGLQPGNNHDQSPYRDPINRRSSEGNTCGFDTDCDPGQECLREGIRGVCVKRQ